MIISRLPWFRIFAHILLALVAYLPVCEIQA